MKIIITFGSNHNHEIDEKIFNKDTIAIVEGENYSECRQKAFDAFGPKFCTDYNIVKLEDENFMRFFKEAIEL